MQTKSLTNQIYKNNASIFEEVERLGKEYEFLPVPSLEARQNAERRLELLALIEI